MTNKVTPIKQQDNSDDDTNQDVRIVILPHGWVMVGRFTCINSQCKLTNAAVIREWGTTKGLGEIADGGPTKSTVLDHAGIVRFHERTIVATIDCSAAKWKGNLH